MKYSKFEREIDKKLVELFKTNLRFTSKNKFIINESEYPNLREIYDSYLKSFKFRNLIRVIKNKYDYEYVKLFYRHSINFLEYYLK